MAWRAVVIRTRERGIGNNTAVPDVLDQIVLAHYAVTVANEIEQKIENLRIDGDEIGAPAQFLSVDINCVIFEFIDQTIFLRRSRHYTGQRPGKNKGKFSDKSGCA